MPENDIWTLLDQNLSGLEKSGQMEMVVETPIPDDLDKILDANLMAIEQAQRPSIGGPKGASLPVIGPAKRPAEAESIIPPWKSAEEITGKAAAQRQADLIGPLSAAPRVLEKVVGAAAGGLEGATSGLVKLSDKISQATGIERGFVLDWIGKTFGNTARYFDRMSRGGEGEAPLPYIVDFAANAAGRASIDIGAMMSMGPLGMPVWTAFNAWKDAPEGKETEALLSGFATGAALHGIFKAINLLPSSLTVPTLGATGTGLGFLQGLDPSHALEEGVTWGGLGLLGGNGKVTKEEFLSRYNEIAAFDNIKAKRFLSQFAAAPDGNIMFVDKAPLLRGDMRGVQPFFTSDMIEAAGGPKELAKKLGGVMANEYGKLDANIRAMVEARKNQLTNEPTPDKVRGEDGKQTEANAGVGAGGDQVLHGGDGGDPGRGGSPGLGGLPGEAGRTLPARNRQVAPEEYVAAFDAAMATHPRRLSATRPDPQSISTGKPILSPDGKSGAVVTADGELAHVFNALDGSMTSFERVVEDGIAEGGKWLNAFNTNLPVGYGQMGYRPVAKIKFNPEYAPEGWSYEAYARYNGGQPDVVFMVHDGVERSPSETRALVKGLEYTADYDTAAAIAKGGGVTAGQGSSSAAHPLRVLEAKLMERLPTATTEAEKADLMSALQEVRDIIKKEAGESTPVAPEVVAPQPEAPPAAVEPEAPKPAAPSKKKTVETPDEDFVPQPSVMMTPGGKRGQVTTADNLRDMDLVLRNNAPVGMVEKGQGAAAIKALREKYPDDEFTISGSPVRGTVAETPESLEMSISKQQAREARMRKKSLLAEGDNPYGDSEIFGDAAEADAKALEAAKKLEAEAAMPEVGDFYRDKDGNQVTIGVQREPGNVTVKTGFGGTWDEPLDQFLKKYRFEEKSVYSREQAAKAAKSKAKAKPATAPPAAPAAAPAPQPAQEQGLTIGTRLVDKSSGEPFVVKEDRGTFIDIASEDGKTTRSVRADAINSLFDRLGGGKMGIVAPGVVELGKAIDKFKTAFLDKFYPIHATVDALRDAGIGPDTVNDPSVLVRLLAGIPGMAETKIRFKRFTRDASGNLVFNGESLNDIIKPFIHGKDLGRFNDYLVYRRALEVDKNSKGTIKTGVDLDRARLFVARNRNTYDAAATKFTDYFHSLLDELVDSGLMERQTVHDLKVNNPEYAPMKRVLEEMDRHGIPSALKEALDKVGNPVKRMRGSELDIVPPTESAILMTYEITSAVERNRAAQAIIGLRDLSPEMARIITKAKPKMRKVRDMATGEDVWAIADTQDPDVVAVSFDGHRQYWKVPQDIADSMKMIHQAGLGDFVKLLAKPARALRSGATLSPEFMLRNPMRDVLTAYMNAKGGFNPLIDFPKGLFQLIAKPEEYWRWKASGGEWSMLASMDRAFGTDAIKQMEKESQGGLARFKKSPLGYLEAISEAGEKPTRLGVFSRSKRKGMSDLEAAIESREASTDFHTRGSSDIVRSWGAMSTFFNARLQTTVKLARTAKEDPVRFAIKGFAAAGIPSALLYYFNRNDPDYWKRSELERDTFWFLPVEIAGRQVKIPKGEVGLMFGTTVEKVLQYLDDKAEYRPKLLEFLGRLVQNSVPIGNWGETLPVAVRPVMEWVTNRSFYYGTPLVQDTLEKKAAYLQYKPQTSETMKAIGKGLAKVFPEGGGASPTKLENTVRGYTGGLGRLALRATDWVGDKLGAFDAGARPSDPINIPGVSGLLSQKAVGFESEPARRFYEIAENLERYKTTWKELAKRGGSEEIKQWMDTHPTETKILMSGLDKEWSSKRDELSSLRKAMNLIVENKTLSGPEKARALEVLNKQVSALVDPMWKVVNQLEKAPTPRR